MIRNDAEYREAAERLKAEAGRLAAQRRRLREAGLSAAEQKRVMDPMVSFHLQLKEEMAAYERLQRREFDEIEDLRGAGEVAAAREIVQVDGEAVDALEARSGALQGVQV
jgi:hypothetical protein